jgi:signal transduction histidine kinase
VLRISIVTILLLAPALHAQERLVRHFGPEQGLLAPTAVALAQDRTGFLWVATAGGVFRYDGVEMRRWAPQVLVHANFLATAADGRVAAADDYGHLFLLDAAGATLVPGPGGAALDSVGAITFVGDTLWAARGARLLVQLPDGRWLPPVAGLDGPPRRLRPAPNGGVDAATRGGVWTATPNGSAQRLFPLPGAWDVVALPDGRRVAISGAGPVVEWSRGRLTTRLATDKAGRALAIRGDVIWAGYSAAIVALHPDGSTETLGPRDGVDGGGPLLVDREGSLWVGTYTALLQLPEPETTWWSERDGLPSTLTRYVGVTHGAVWVTTWGGLGRLTHDARGWHGSAPVKGGYDRVWADAARDRLLVGTDHGTVALRGASFAFSRAPQPPPAAAYAPAEGGGLWVGTSEGLYHTDDEGGKARLVPGTPFGRGAVVVLAVDSGRTLWAAGEERVCALRGTWTCDTLAGALDVTALVAFPSGDLWAATRGRGVMRRHGGAWAPLPGARALPTSNVLNLIPSRGAIWVAAFGAVLRVAERPDSADGWQVLEHLTGWHGLPGRGANDVFEETDGTVWLTTARGVMRVPAAARRTPRPPPSVTLVDARVDTEAVALAGALVLPHERNRLELRFASLSLRDPSAIVYQVRLSPHDPWQDTRGLPSFRWVDLPGGRYRAEVRASADGKTWSSTPAAFAFVVRPAWYREPWAMALFSLALVGALVAAYRARVAVLLGLERQRARIAMDLHDEIGSALGSIGILSGVLAQDNGDDERERQRIADEIARTAGEVGGALSDIVWALDPRPGTLRDLATRLADHGGRLFAGDGPEFRTHFPAAWPGGPLPLGLRRNVAAIGLEALHNAARHARARNVALALTPPANGGAGVWELTVTDDGSGMPTPAPDSGLGVTSARRRAAEIGAEVTWEATSGGGTTLRLRFPLDVT